MNKLDFKQLTSERLFLRSLSKDDYEKHFKYMSNEDNFPYADMDAMKSIGEVKDYFSKLQKGMNNKEWLFWIISDKESREALGTISLWNINRKKELGEFGFGLYPAGRGKGYMVEALKTVIAYCFDSLDMKMLQGWTSADNEAAINVLEASGFKYLKTEFEDAYTHDGEVEYRVYEIKK